MWLQVRVCVAGGMRTVACHLVHSPQPQDRRMTRRVDWLTKVEMAAVCQSASRVCGCCRSTPPAGIAAADHGCDGPLACVLAGGSVLLLRLGRSLHVATSPNVVHCAVKHSTAVTRPAHCQSKAAAYADNRRA